MKQEDLTLIEQFQNNPYMHNLTCGKNSSHAPLAPILCDDRLILICTECTYAQQVDEKLLSTIRGVQEATEELLEILGQASE